MDKELEQCVRRLIEHTGDPELDRPGLAATPARVVRSYATLYSGYQINVEQLIAQALFREEGADEMVIVRDIEFFSMCEHHMLPFFGRAHIGYVPHRGVILGLSKLARVLEAFARRLQVQERICSQVANALCQSSLNPLGAGCVIEATHLCMVCRGVQKQHAKTITSAMHGVFLDKPECRAEFLSFIK